MRIFRESIDFRVFSSKCIYHMFSTSFLFLTVQILVRYTNYVEIVPKKILIFRKIPKIFLKFCKNTPKNS